MEWNNLQLTYNHQYVISPKLLHCSELNKPGQLMQNERFVFIAFATLFILAIFLSNHVLKLHRPKHQIRREDSTWIDKNILPASSETVTPNFRRSDWDTGPVLANASLRRKTLKRNSQLEIFCNNQVEDVWKLLKSFAWIEDFSNYILQRYPVGWVINYTIRLFWLPHFFKQKIFLVQNTKGAHIKSALYEVSGFVNFAAMCHG